MIDPGGTETRTLGVVPFLLPLQDVHHRLIHVDQCVVVALLGQLPKSTRVPLLNHDPAQCDGPLFPVDESPPHPQRLTAPDIGCGIDGPQRCVSEAVVSQTAVTGPVPAGLDTAARKRAVWPSSTVGYFCSCARISRPVGG
jgi:hypothetical protein